MDRSSSADGSGLGAEGAGSPAEAGRDLQELVSGVFRHGTSLYMYARLLQKQPDYSTPRYPALGPALQQAKEHARSWLEDAGWKRLYRGLYQVDKLKGYYGATFGRALEDPTAAAQRLAQDPAAREVLMARTAKIVGFLEECAADADARREGFTDLHAQVTHDHGVLGGLFAQIGRDNDPVLLAQKQAALAALDANLHAQEKHLGELIAEQTGAAGGMACLALGFVGVCLFGIGLFFTTSITEQIQEQEKDIRRTHERIGRLTGEILDIHAAAGVASAFARPLERMTASMATAQLVLQNEGSSWAALGQELRNVRSRLGAIGRADSDELRFALHKVAAAGRELDKASQRAHEILQHQLIPTRVELVDRAHS